ncbi:cytochrome P450 [Aspergillus karnatakaensis]|uniref:cytochrome P450 n=1 Tax=Aspergillus karnatakaensis TaxID=1810916 RepID=UPI003CCE187F
MTTMEPLRPPPPTTFIEKHWILFLALTLFLTHRLAIALYNLYFHPLARFPGPKLNAISNLPYYYYLTIKGEAATHVATWHSLYGDVVRIRPNELSFTNPSAWTDIMGHRSGPEMGKDPHFYSPVTVGPPNLANAPRAQHGVFRRLMAHGFSEQAMRAQEPLIRGYVDLLVRRLREHSHSHSHSHSDSDSGNENGEKAVDMAAWYNYTTFDVIGDLAFGEGFGCLAESRMHPWIEVVTSMGRFMTVLQFVSLYPVLKGLVLGMMPRAVKEAGVEHARMAREKVLRRMELGERPDLINTMIKKREEWNISIEQLTSNAELFITAGSESTATMLAGTTYFLTTHPEEYRKVVEEVRSSFKNEDEITLLSVSKLSYMLACLNEGMRLYHPISGGLPRLVHEGGAVIAGDYVPEGTTVAVHHYATYRQERNFTDALSFHPERFLNDLRFANDKIKAFQPFNVGPRDCVGRNLAYAEMRLILARVLYNFDLRIAEDSLEWTKQKSFLFWKKPALNMYLTAVR